MKSPAPAQSPDILDRRDPLRTSRRFLAREFTREAFQTLAFVDDEFYLFRDTAFEVLAKHAVRKMTYEFLEKAASGTGRKDSGERFKPTARDVDNVLDAMRSITFAPVHSPAWLEQHANDIDPRTLIVAENGLFRIEGGRLVRVGAPTPRLFTTNALAFPLNRDGRPPVQWLAFLRQVFAGDSEQIALLQEWMGYLLTSDTSLQKMLLMIGPPRSGKGTIARVITKLLGSTNVVGPTLASLGTNFGLAPLHRKLLAIVSDARLSGRTDTAIVTERILSISGEDFLTIDRKNQQPITARITARIMLLSNELPKIADSSGALASRFLMLAMTESFLGREDTQLEQRLSNEIPSIASWAIDGLIRLSVSRTFTRAQAGDELREELADLGSPISAFLRDWCRIAAGLQISVADLYLAWTCWCREQGRNESGNQQTFGRDIRAALPAIKVSRPRTEDGSRSRFYEGVGLTATADQIMSATRAANHDRSGGLYG